MKKCFTLLLLLATATAFAQPTLRWQKNYGGSASDTAYSIKETADKGFIVAGTSRSVNGDVTGNHGNGDYWIVKLDAAGNIAWQKCYGGSGRDVAKCAVQTSDGGYIVAGYSASTDGDVTDHNLPCGTHYYDAWILKLNSAGNITWKKSVVSAIYYPWAPNPAGDGLHNLKAFANTIIQTSDGGYLLGGWRGTDEPGLAWLYPFSWVVKLTSTGTVSWHKSQKMFDTYGLLDDIGVQSIVQTSSSYTILTNGPLLLGGAAGDCTNAQYENTFLCNLNLSGTMLWSHIYGHQMDTGPLSSRPISVGKSLGLTSDGGYIVAGKSNGTDGCLTGAGNHGDYDAWVFKTTSTGSLVWSKCLGGSNYDAANAVHQSADGNYYVAGLSYSNNGNVTDHISIDDIWVTKLNSSGTLQWSKSYGGTNSDLATALAKTSDGGYVAAGMSRSSYSTIVNKGNGDWLLVKFDDCNVAMPTAPSPQTFNTCSTPTVGNLLPTGGTFVKWYSSATATTPLSTSTPLPRGTYTYYVAQKSITGCESIRRAVSITVSSPCLRPMPGNVPAAPAEEIIKLTISPNPNTGIFSLQLPVDKNTAATEVRILNATGAIVWRKKCSAYEGRIQEKVNIATLSAGVYMLQYADNNNTYTIKLVKQ